MGIEVITINVGGMTYTAFEVAQVRASFEEAARSFRLEIAAELGASATNRVFAVGTKLTIHANGDLLLTGFVDQKQPRIEATKAMITVNGRSNSGDLVDSSAKHETGQFENKDPMEIGNAVAEGIGAKFTTDQQLEKIEQYQVNPGESVFRLVEKMARQQGMTITGTADGNAQITKAGNKRHAGGLIEGHNILTGTADHNGSNRHSEYIVRGQRPFGHGVDNLQIEAIARDKGVDRHRPIIIVQDEDTTKKRTKKKAKNRKDRAAGHALKATIDTQGFRDDGGKLWEPGYLVWVESPFLDIAQDMLIESVTYMQSEQGSIATLGLTDPRAYGGKGSDGKGNQSGKEWSMDDSEAE
jgi:prophage tail gpP-like protein